MHLLWFSLATARVNRYHQQFLASHQIYEASFYIRDRRHQGGLSYARHLQLSASLHMDQRLFALGRSHASKAVGRPSLWWGLSALSLTEMPPFLENGSQSSRINPH